MVVRGRLPARNYFSEVVHLFSKYLADKVGFIIGGGLVAYPQVFSLKLEKEKYHEDVYSLGRR